MTLLVAYFPCCPSRVLEETFSVFEVVDNKGIVGARITASCTRSCTYYFHRPSYVETVILISIPFDQDRRNRGCLFFLALSAIFPISP